MNKHIKTKRRKKKDKEKEKFAKFGKYQSKKVRMIHNRRNLPIIINPKKKKENDKVLV